MHPASRPGGSGGKNGKQETDDGDIDRRRSQAGGDRWKRMLVIKSQLLFPSSPSSQASRGSFRKARGEGGEGQAMGSGRKAQLSRWAGWASWPWRCTAFGETSEPCGPEAAGL
eukprot:CAMPEP_0194755266 /NCGR_PEP_ID=MMETSP0323_2-20130528/9166_1 /TAXON_ID=2866 ORGANISM="Crypthecodinium cohnii, Strain Seligo" /NCGR_SAMPLE_ID=MMETSP0323_2 /ASSEMBLY_ACC=CAM_ASM_000346 /LENGTH=112 /DNA_ID=CAMNT_0039674251 /DNA_START=86 /DNA_END=422 /DNA_ORIENTATION=-